MKFLDLIPTIFISREKRFTITASLKSGEIIKAYCPNTGSLLGVLNKNSIIWMSKQPDDKKRKYKYRCELVEYNNFFVGINTQHPNNIIHEALQNNLITELSGYTNILREIVYQKNSRVDFVLKGPNKLDCYLEVKNVHYKKNKGAYFPDSITTRGTKHIFNLIEQKKLKYRCVVLYLIQRSDCEYFSIAKDIDINYYNAMKIALLNGVEFYAYDCDVNTNKIDLSKRVRIVI